jgi:putative colanic acid biosynthesis glycosyltransferase
LINNFSVKPKLSPNIILSIITVAKNDRARLSKTIKSLDVIYNDERFEHIIVDCLSVDGTSDLLSKVVENTNVIVVSGLDFGIYDAMNKGSNLASGSFELYLNSGDELLALPEQIVKWCNQINPSYIDIACFPCLLQFGNRRLFLRPMEYTKYRMPTSHQAMIFSRNFIVNHPYNIKYRIAGDFELYLQTSPGRVCAVSAKSPLTLIQGEGFASTNPLIAYREYLHIVLNRYQGTARLMGLIVIFCKGMIMVVLKKIIPKRWINYFRVIEW